MGAGLLVPVADWWVVMLIALVLRLLLGYLSGRIAYSKGRSFWLFFALAIFLPIITLIIVAILPRRTETRKTWTRDLR